MMTLTNAIKRAEKKAGKPATIKGQFYQYEYKDHIVQFAKNGSYDEACNFYTRSIGTEDDHSTDYFAGIFHDNLKQAFDFVDAYVLASERNQNK